MKSNSVSEKSLHVLLKCRSALKPQNYWPRGSGETTGGAKPPGLTLGQKRGTSSKTHDAPDPWLPTSKSTRKHGPWIMSAAPSSTSTFPFTTRWCYRCTLSSGRKGWHFQKSVGILLRSGQVGKIICRLLVIKKGLHLFIFKQPAWSCRVILIIQMRSSQNPMPQLTFL